MPAASKEPSPKALPSTAQSVFFSLLGNFLPPVFGLLVMPLVLRQVGSERFGIFALLMACATYFAVFDLGTGRGTTYFVSKHALRKPARAAGILLAARRMQLWVGLLLGCCWFLTAPLLVNYALKVPDALHGETLYAFWVIGLSFPFVLGVSAAKGAMEGLGRFDLSNQIRIGTSLLTFLLPLLISYVTPNMVWIALGMLAGRICAFVLYEIKVRQLLVVHVRLSKKLFWQYFRLLVNYGGWVMLAVVLGALMSMGYLDRFVVGSLVSLEAVAHYAIPNEMAVRILMIPGAISGIFFTQAATCSGFTKASLQAFNRKVYACLIGGTLPPLLVVFLFREEILRLLMGAQYHPVSSEVLVLLLVGVFFNTLAHVPYTLLQATGNPRPTAMRHVVQLPFYVAAACFFTGEYGIYGAAVVWMSWAVVDYFMLIFLARTNSSVTMVVA